MPKSLRLRNLVILAAFSIAFLILQLTLFLHAESARAVTLEYMGRSVFSESQWPREEEYYDNGRDRVSLRVPVFDSKFRMHEATFAWIENSYIPPDADTDLTKMWVGTCTLTPKSPWRQIDVFGLLGPMQCHVYGDWHVETTRE